MTTDPAGVNENAFAIRIGRRDGYNPFTVCKIYGCICLNSCERVVAVIYVSLKKASRRDTHLGWHIAFNGMTL